MKVRISCALVCGDVMTVPAAVCCLTGARYADASGRRAEPRISASDDGYLGAATVQFETRRMRRYFGDSRDLMDEYAPNTGPNSASNSGNR